MTSDTDLITRHVAIAGRVQGVGFRNWTHWKARRLGLSGFVRNRRDGSVEALFTGPGTAVAAMLAACRDGPPGAHVTGISDIDGGEAATGPFQVLPTV